MTDRECYTSEASRHTRQGRNTFALRSFFLRELVQIAKITIHHVGTGKVLADVATKYLGKAQHHEILQQIKELSR